MHQSRHKQYLPSHQYMFTVSNPSHELVNPQQYTHLVSTISQYQLIPGFLSENCDDPWDVVVRLLPYSRNTIIDVTLPFVVGGFQQGIDSMSEDRTLGRYILYKQQLVGIRVLTHPALKASSSTTQPSNKVPTQPLLKYPIPTKLQTYYTQNNITNYSASVTVGDFYLTTSKFKIALFFQSEIKDVAVLNPYFLVGCEIVSIVNDQEVDFETFLGNYMVKTNHQFYLEGNGGVVKEIRKACWNSNAILLYGGCKTSPSLVKVYFTRSFIEYGNDENRPGDNRSLQTSDVQFYPLIDLTKKKNFTTEPEFNSNRLNICQEYNINRSRSFQRQPLNNNRMVNEQCEVQSLEMDSGRFDVRPLSIESKEKLKEFAQTQYFYQRVYERKRLFNLTQLTARSVIKCMYVFNMLNLFIFSRPPHLRSPFIIGVPFTQKSKNLLDSIIYIYDNLKEFQASCLDLQLDFKLTDILRLYRYKDQRNDKHDYTVEEDLLIRVTEDEGICIPTIEEIVRLHEKSKPLYLCSDDMQEKKKLKAVCKEAGVELNCLDLIMVDQFTKPLEVRPTYDQFIESVVELEKYHNVLQRYNLKLRTMPTEEELLKINENQNKRQYPPSYVRLCQELSKKNFLSIQSALKWIILEKEFLYEKSNEKLFHELIIKQLGRKAKTNIKILSSLNTFFIANSEEQIIEKVSQMAQQIMKTKQNLLPFGNSINSLPSNDDIIVIQDEQVEQKQNENQQNSRNRKIEQTKKPETQDKNQEQLRASRLERCKKIKAEKQKKLILKCHKCQTQMSKKLLQKCKKCKQMICVACIEEISGLSWFKACQKLSNFCPVCNKTCNCDKCKKKLQKILRADSVGTGIVEESKISEDLRKILMDEEKPQQDDLKQKPNTLTQVSDFVMKSLNDQHKNAVSFQIKHCQKCEILNMEKKRYISIECISCGQQSCYSCVQQMYKQADYKPVTIKTFYKNWKCEICDLQWQRFLANKMIGEKIRQNPGSIQMEIRKNNPFLNSVMESNKSIDYDVISNHTSHYAQNQNLMEIAEFSELQLIQRKSFDPRVHFYNKRRSSVQFEKSQQQQYQSQRKDSLMDMIFVPNSQANTFKNQKSDQQKSPSFRPDQSVNHKNLQHFSLFKPAQVIIPQVYPPPQASFLPTFGESSKQISVEFKKTQSQKKQKKRRASSDSGYESKEDNQTKQITVAFRSEKQKEEKEKSKNKGGPIWGSKSKQKEDGNGNTKRKRSDSSMSFSSDSNDKMSEKSKNDSEISFKGKPSVREQDKNSFAIVVNQFNSVNSLTVEKENKKEEGGGEKIGEDARKEQKVPHHVNGDKKKGSDQKRERGRGRERRRRNMNESYESGQIRSSSPSSSSSSSSSRSFSSSSRSSSSSQSNSNSSESRRRHRNRRRRSNSSNRSNRNSIRNKNITVNSSRSKSNSARRESENRERGRDRRDGFGSGSRERRGDERGNGYQRERSFSNWRGGRGGAAGYDNRNNGSSWGRNDRKGNAGNYGSNNANNNNYANNHNNNRFNDNGSDNNKSHINNTQRRPSNERYNNQNRSIPPNSGLLFEPNNKKRDQQQQIEY